MQKILLVILCLAVTCSGDFQLSKYNPPNTVNYTTCYLANGSAKSYCPIGTFCTAPQLPTGLFLGASSAVKTVISQFSAPGCCPVNTTACQSHRFPFTVPACCPNTQICCFDNYQDNKFLGCADDARQCCGSTICPSGYSCCRRNGISEFYCCPGLAACSILTSTNMTNITYYANQYPRGSNSVLDMPISSTCMQVINATYAVNWTASQVVPCGKTGALCLNATEDCYSGNGTNLSTNTNNNQTITSSLGVLCCRKNTNACTNAVARGSNTLIGCADPTRNETCCGQSICPGSSRCCHVAPPNDGTYAPNTLFPYNFFNNSGIYTGATPIGNGTTIPGYIFPTDRCCPKGTFCCARRVNLDGTLNPLTRTIYVFCGRNEMCTSDALITESLQPKPSLSGFLPEYIESLGWITPANVFASSPTNYACGTCSATGATSTACQDNCRLDITAASHCP